MAKHKLQRFAEIETFPNVFQPRMGFPMEDYELKGKWRETFFKNDNPVILELGCGRGEYTVNLAEAYPEKNFVGVDIKGARLWRGAKTAVENNMANVAFLRIHIDKIEHFFAPGEVDEIWVTFPDPQPQLSREKKRLTSPNFLRKYKNILSEKGIVHLKTDNAGLFNYTLESVKEQKHHLEQFTHDLYRWKNLNEILQIKTTYEKMFLKQGLPIHYMNFRLNPEAFATI